MDPRFQTSFIPKKPLIPQSSKVRSTAPINLFSLIGTVIFIAAIALAGAAFFYSSVINKQIDAGKATLDRAKGAFEPQLIAQIVRLDTRINASKGLLAQHVAVTPLFDFISSITLKTVRFKNFAFSYLASDQISVTMQGQAQSYASVALQSDLLNQQKYLKDTIVGDMSLDPTGLVSFTVSTIIDPTVLSYKDALTRGAVGSYNPTSSQTSQTVVQPVGTTTATSTGASTGATAPAATSTSATSTRTQ